jgi:hypothetical protein
MEGPMKLNRVMGVTFGILLWTVAMASAQSSTMPSDMKGRHSMEGEVTKVDAKKGWVDLKTAQGTMILHFPPDALATVKKGDRIAVELGLKDHGPAAKK